jgi:hypothetical protein
VKRIALVALLVAVARPAGAQTAPRVQELPHLWVDPQPPTGAVYNWTLGAGRGNADLRGWDPGYYVSRPGLDVLPNGYESFPRLFQEGGGDFRGMLFFQGGAGPMLDRNVDEAALLAQYPVTLPQELVGGRLSYKALLRAQLRGPIVENRLFFFADAIDDRVAGTALGATQDEVRSSPRYTLNLTWAPATRVTVGGRYEASLVDNAGLSAWQFASARRHRALEEGIAVATVRHQLDARNEVAASYEVVFGRDDTSTAGGVTVPAHYNLDTFQTFQNYPMTTRRRYLEQRADLHWSTFLDGLLLADDSHTFTLGAQLELQNREDDVTRNGGFSFSDQVPNDANGNPLATIDENDRATWTLYSSDRGDELHAKTALQSYAAYAMDRIRFGSALTVTPSLRVEHFRGGFSGGAMPWSSLGIAPRVTATWDVDGWTTLFLNAGRHYQSLDASMVTRARQGAAISPLEYWDWTGDPGTTPDPTIADPRWVRTQQFPAVVGDLTNIKHPYADRFVVGLTRSFDSLGLRASMRYEYRRYGDLVAIVDAQGVYEQKTGSIGSGPNDQYTYQNLVPGSRQGYAITNPPDAQREQHSFNAGLSYAPWRFLTLRGAVTVAVDRGNLDSTSGLSTEWQDPNGKINAYGNMGAPPWTVRAGATIYAPLGLRLWIDYTGRAGAYYSRAFFVRPDAAPRTYVYDSAGRGGYQYPNRHLVDFAVGRDIARIGGGTLDAWVQIYNLFNDGTVTGLREVATYFRSVRSLVAPREILLGARYVF